MCKKILIQNLNLSRIRMVLSTEEVQEIFQGMKGTQKVMTKMMTLKTMALNRDHQILISNPQRKLGSPV
jgi:hypothetical protein